MTSKELEHLLEHAKEGRLVLFVGAGISVLAPTFLPSWWQINQAVTTSLATEAAKVIGDELPQEFAQSIHDRQNSGKLPPEYQAELLANRLSGDKYFRVLQCLDGDRPNQVHMGIAALAKAGQVKAIVTTNFDRVLENAFTKSQIPFELHASPQDFKALSQDLTRFEQGDTPCQILKIHGSAEDPGTLIDTLAQRKKGLEPSKGACVRYLQQFGHWLFLGYSGADLQKNPNYLHLRGELQKSKGFSWLIREGTSPLEVVKELANQYDSKGHVIFGELPEWFNPLLEGLQLQPLQVEEADSTTLKEEARQQVDKHTQEWAADFGPLRCGVLLANIADAAASGTKIVPLLEALYQQSPESEKETEPYAYVCHALGNAMSELGRHKEALSYLKQARSVLETAGNDKQAAKLLSEIGDAYRSSGRLDDALEHYLQAESKLQEDEDEDTKAIIRDDLAGVYFDRAELQKAQELYQQNLDYYRSKGDEHSRALTLNLLANVDAQRENYAQAKMRYHESINIYAGLGDEDGKASILNNLGRIDYLTGEYEQAEERWKQALEIYQLLQQRQSIAHSKNNLAMLAQKQGDFETSTRYLKEILVFFEASDDLNGQAKTLGNLGNLYRDTQRSEEALPLYQKALALFEQMGNLPAAAPWYDEWSELHRNQEEWSKAASLSEKAFALYKDQEDHEETGNTAYNLAVLMDRMERYKKAEQWAKQALHYYQLTNDAEQIQEANALVEEYGKRARGELVIPKSLTVFGLVVLLILFFLVKKCF